MSSDVKRSFSLKRRTNITIVFNSKIVLAEFNEGISKCCLGWAVSRKRKFHRSRLEGDHGASSLISSPLARSGHQIFRRA